MKPCKYCSSTNLDTRTNGIHKELFCVDCGRHQQFIKQEHNTESDCPASLVQQRYALDLLLQWKNRAIPMTARQAGTIIQLFK
jgi:hypothetical protein